VSPQVGGLSLRRSRMSRAARRQVPTLDIVERGVSLLKAMETTSHVRGRSEHGLLVAGARACRVTVEGMDLKVRIGSGTFPLPGATPMPPPTLPTSSTSSRRTALTRCGFRTWCPPPTPSTH
jgi:hypothetical protein